MAIALIVFIEVDGKYLADFKLSCCMILPVRNCSSLALPLLELTFSRPPVYLGPLTAQVRLCLQKRRSLMAFINKFLLPKVRVFYSIRTDPTLPETATTPVSVLRAGTEVMYVKVALPDKIVVERINYQPKYSLRTACPCKDSTI